MSENDAKEPTGHDEASSTSLEFDQRVAHLKAGYDNSQSVVRFLDTKASAVIATIPVVIAVLTALFGVVKDWGQWKDAFASRHSCVLWTALITTALVAAALLLSAVFAIVSAFKAITPRDTGIAKPSVLFPFEKNYAAAWPDNSFASRVAFFKGEAKRLDVLEDYERQIIRMGEITAQKLGCVDDAVKHLKRFFVTAVILLGFVCATTLMAAALASANGVGNQSASPRKSSESTDDKSVSPLTTKDTGAATRPSDTQPPAR
jgi:hypothetical protein